MSKKESIVLNIDKAVFDFFNGESNDYNECIGKVLEQHVYGRIGQEQKKLEDQRPKINAWLLDYAELYNRPCVKGRGVIWVHRYGTGTIRGLDEEKGDLLVDFGVGELKHITPADAIYDLPQPFISGDVVILKHNDSRLEIIGVVECSYNSGDEVWVRTYAGDGVEAPSLGTARYIYQDGCDWTIRHHFDMIKSENADLIDVSYLL